MTQHDCPNKECHADVQKHDRALYGDDGLGGINKCVKAKVSKKMFWALIGIVGGPLVLMYGLYYYSADLFASTKDMAEIKSALAVHDNSEQYTRAALNELRVALGELQKTNVAISQDLIVIKEQLKRMDRRNFNR